MSRRSRRLLQRRQQPQVLPLRLSVDEKGVISYPVELTGRGRRPAVDPSRRWLPAAEIVGVEPESLMDAAISGDLADLRLPDGAEPYVHHLHVEQFAYEFSPVPTLTLVMPPTGDGASRTRFRFVDAVMTDWLTDKDYDAGHPNHELCDLMWDGWRNFLLGFLSFKLIVRATRLEVEAIEWR